MAIGALASSAPILYFDDITPPNAYMDVVSRGFKEVSETCYETILNSWSEIDKVASQPNGLSILSQRFNTCYPLNQSFELSNYLENMYTAAAQYNHPPEYPVTVICVVAQKGNGTCKINSPTNISETSVGWEWQTCSEMVMPFGIGNDTMFQPYPFNLKRFVEKCRKEYDVLPRPHWITTYYGGHNIKLVLQKFGSNIIFSNGLKDPYSSSGVLNDLSDSIVAIQTNNGSHCLDILPSKQSDPGWLIEQRKKEVEIIQGWIAQYYIDLGALYGAPKLQNN
ncbi:lysosomal Pro-Xaa carboxypeptidase [Trifolium repens]|nr:lysosomal Pro-Xaa carboxypeptidase [Trifolium repens]